MKLASSVLLGLLSATSLTVVSGFKGGMQLFSQGMGDIDGI